MISLKWDMIIFEFVSCLFYIVIGIELDFPKTRWIILNYYFIFDRCVDFELDAQMREGIMYEWYLIPNHVGWIYILVVENIDISYMVGGAFPINAIVEYIFYRRNLIGNYPV